MEEGKRWKESPQAGSHRLADYLFYAGDYMFAIGVLLERGEMGLDLLDDHLALSVVHQVEHLLDDVVGVLIFHHDLQWCNAVDS